jgi:serine-type D-Ala-D-Ala endopeptidase (penicillin-binding protein 7)
MRRIFSILVFFTLLYNGQTIASSTQPMSITASSWLVADESGRIIQSENIEQQRSIASITKLMTALVVLDANQNLDEHIGKYTRAETLQLALVHSDNKAAANLCEYYPGGKDACIRAMNTKAHFLGMHDTKYVEATGLSVFNVSTANDLIKLVIAAKEYPEVTQAARTAQVKIKLKKKWFFFNNTNPIIGKRHEFVVSKTGYIRASGGCVAMMLDTDVGRRIVIVLGSKNTKTRIPEAEFIATNF